MASSSIEEIEAAKGLALLAGSRLIGNDCSLEHLAGGVIPRLPLGCKDNFLSKFVKPPARTPSLSTPCGSRIDLDDLAFFQTRPPQAVTEGKGGIELISTHRILVNGQIEHLQPAVLLHPFTELLKGDSGLRGETLEIERLAPHFV